MLIKPAFWVTMMVTAAVIPPGGKRHHLGASRRLPAPHRPCERRVLVSLIDNVLKALLVKGSLSTPNIFILFSIPGGITYFGMIGFILGPLMLSFLLAILRIYQKTILLQPGSVLPTSLSAP